ncbi:unnamed protein product [Cuscuta europaea]|uniref:non-specific serine/threonine protein kinase n=1 Tax=Cuscuta europaea TaxID=41803 RepID=A0A9P1EL92_CUSEU|nr:unnamed protein product [Cuscuta europaea]
MERVKKKLGKYELGRTIGEGTFAKVKFAQNTETGESVAIKVLAKSTILKHQLVEQIKREISIMKILRHPCIVKLHEVLSSQTKLYFVLEFVSGGVLFDKIVHQGRLCEDEARRYFQQLIDAVAHCHSKGVYHRDLKPENLLLDSIGNLKVSDFGLSALPMQGVELLHTTCGTPNYVAPEVLGQRGYDGAAADVWSCGVILYVLLAGSLPFDEAQILPLYRKRIKIEGIRKDQWFQKNYLPIQGRKDEKETVGDVCAVLYGSEHEVVTEQCQSTTNGPFVMNAFEMIALSQGLNLSPLFDRCQDFVKRQTRFVSREPAKVIICAIEAAARSMGLKFHSSNYKTRMEGVSGNRGKFAIALEVFQVAPSLHIVDVRKAAGDTLEYHRFYKNFCEKIDHVIWKSTEGVANAAPLL